nr:GatB/YqeY domain-containing protein [Leucobacter exalbidus]
MKAELTIAQRTAMKDRAAAEPGDAKDAAERRLLAIRSALGALGEAETAGKARHELSAEEQIAVVKKEVAKREASAEIYDGASEPERANNERLEAEVLRAFLPQETSEDEVRAFVERIVAEQQLAGQGGRAIGVVMAALKADFANFDSRSAAKIVQTATK